MARYDAELLVAARRLLSTGGGRTGQVPSACIRRSISTTYYALFHFISNEVALRTLGSHSLLQKRRILVRVITHKGLRTTLDKVRGARIDPSVSDFFQMSSPSAPSFVCDFANAFSDAQTKRHDADYDLNKTLSETDARLLRTRVQRAIKQWEAATAAADKDFKHALCVLILLKGQLRAD